MSVSDASTEPFTKIDLNISDKQFETRYSCKLLQIEFENQSELGVKIPVIPDILTDAISISILGFQDRFQPAIYQFHKLEELKFVSTRADNYDFKRFSKLKKLFLSAFSLDLWKLSIAHPKISELSVHWNKSTKGMTGIIKTIDLSGLPSLKSLDLFHVEEVEEIISTKKLPKLESITADDCYDLSNWGMKFLKKCPALKKFHLGASYYYPEYPFLYPEKIEDLVIYLDEPENLNFLKSFANLKKLTVVGAENLSVSVLEEFPLLNYKENPDIEPETSVATEYSPDDYDDPPF